MKRHAVDAVDVGNQRDSLTALLAAARRHDIKIITRVETPRASEVIGAVQAVMIGGAYQGKAIDRFRFPFTASRQEIVIEAPIYHREQVYGDAGHYYLGLGEPLRAEVAVRQKEFDGAAHVLRIPASLTRQDERHWRMQFDLTGVRGDLQNVMLAVYWTCDREERGFHNGLSARAPSSQAAAADAARRMVNTWKEANGGTFPGDQVFAVRIGDEEWNRSGHTSTTEAASYPLWDYSEAAVTAFKSRYPDLEVPLGRSWIDTFGREAYAAWLYLYHEGNAALVRTIKQALNEAGAPNLLTFRNLTRAGVYSEMNDVDGTGLDLLVQAFDIAQIDPYPVGARSYNESLIPTDMAYVSGLARRHGKYLVPWMQGHQYYPEGYFGLVHPSPEQANRMILQHRRFNPDALLWLGYGPGEFYTFPTMRPDTWEAVTAAHWEYFMEPRRPLRSRLGVVRPYTVRALRDAEHTAPQDRFLTDVVLAYLNREGIPFEPIEPLDTDELETNLLRRYQWLVSSVGDLSTAALYPFREARRPVALLIEGADRSEIDYPLTGIKSFRRRSEGKPLQVKAADGTTFEAEAADFYELDPQVVVLATIDGSPVVWQNDDLLFIAVRGSDEDLPAFLWNRLQETARVQPTPMR